MADAYDAAGEAYHAARAQGLDAVYPPQPEHGTDKGYCDLCWTALCQSREPWPADVWEVLDAQAAAGNKGSNFLKPYRLPGYPGARKEKPAKWLERAAKAYSPGKGADDKVLRVQGRFTEKDEHGLHWQIVQSDGCTALLLPGPALACQAARTPEEEKPYTGISPAASGDWLELAPTFHEALSRVRLLANERSEAVRLSANADGTVTLAAGSPEYGTATETVDVIVGRLDRGLFDRTVYDATLSAVYLDALCGCWPLRWYLRPPTTETAAPSRWTPNPKPTRVEHAQLFEPAGTGARVLIMPMRT